MTKVWGHSPECMDAVDHPGHVLLIIDVGGLWEEGLGRKPAGYCHWRPLSSTRYTEGAEEWGILSDRGCAPLLPGGLRSVSPTTFPNALSVRKALGTHTEPHTASD